MSCLIKPKCFTDQVLEPFLNTQSFFKFASLWLQSLPAPSDRMSPGPIFPIRMLAKCKAVSPGRFRLDKSCCDPDEYRDCAVVVPRP